MERTTETPQRRQRKQIKRLGPNHYAFAKLVGEGRSQYEAFLAVNPNARDWQRSSADSEASMWANSPKIREQIELHAIGAQEYGRAILPKAIQRTAHLIDHAQKEETQLKAADSIADRFGAPRNAQIALNAQTLSLNLLADLESDPASQSPQIPTESTNPTLRTGVPQSDSPAQTIQDMSQARAEWALIEAKPKLDKG